MKQLTREQAKAVARKYCELEGDDPDRPTYCGGIWQGEIQMFPPYAWENVLGDIYKYRRIQIAMAELGVDKE